MSAPSTPVNGWAFASNRCKSAGYLPVVEQFPVTVPVSANDTTPLWSARSCLDQTSFDSIRVDLQQGERAGVSVPLWVGTPTETVPVTQPGNRNESAHWVRQCVSNRDHSPPSKLLEGTDRFPVHDSRR